MTTTMTMPPTRRWDKIQELIDSMGLTILTMFRNKQEWKITFAEDLNPGDKTQLEARVLHTMSGIDWS